MTFKQKILRVLSFIGGILFLGILFIIGLAKCYERLECWIVYNIPIYGAIGLATVYLIFRFVVYLKNKNSK